ncbi:hypothetical protein PENSPDRAFT_662718 [Peniophora sp. CONT]|nr:hypothetical protein PENSPDRAFT_662718 [Peniophora sp. CONT]
MPFSYLQQPDNEQPAYGFPYNSEGQQGQQHSEGSSSSPSSATLPPAHHVVGGMFSGMPATAGNIPLQVPPFLFGSQSTLAPGGGAEVLSAGLITPGAWFSASSPSASLFNAIDWGQTPTQQPQAEATPAPAPIYAPAPTTASGVSWSGTATSPPASLAPTMQPPQAPPNQLAAYAGAGAALGLPVYSTSGFDLLGVLARVVNRQNPTIQLGPVDMSCSFCVVDKRRYDSPIVYASPTFYHLTGYSEHEVIGRNCRFLQAPGGQVSRGEQRQYVTGEAVNYLRKSLVADKECQTSIVNYRKNGQAFINLVTVVPVAGGLHNGPDEQDEVVYHVGFQVDLTEQPNAILERLRDGTYMVNYSVTNAPQPPPSLYPNARDRRNKLYALASSQEMRDMLAEPGFVSSALPETAGFTTDALTEYCESNSSLSLVLLSALADGLLVLSLKGTFLYASPALARMLGHDAQDLINKNLTDFCHPSDVVPLTRDLKESSAPSAPADTQAAASAHAEAGVPLPRAPLQGAPKPVNLLFRARTGADGVGAAPEYMWLECRGRLHIEPGKGRKAIILSARPRMMPRLSLPSNAVSLSGASEAWSLVSASGSLLTVGPRAREVLGAATPELVGRALVEIAADGSGAEVAAALQRVRQPAASPQSVRLRNGAVGTLHGAPEGAPIILQMQAAGAKQVPTQVDPSSLIDVFGELNANAGESWQFALQQLKLENQELAEKVLELEAGQRSATSTQEKAPLMHGQSAQAPPNQPVPQSPRHQPLQSPRQQPMQSPRQQPIQSPRQQPAQYSMQYPMAQQLQQQASSMPPPAPPPHPVPMYSWQPPPPPANLRLPDTRKRSWGGGGPGSGT